MSKLVVSGKVIVGIDKLVGAAGTVSQLNLPPALVIPFIVSELASIGFTKQIFPANKAFPLSFVEVKVFARIGPVVSLHSLPNEIILSVNTGPPRTSCSLEVILPEEPFQPDLSGMRTRIPMSM